MFVASRIRYLPDHNVPIGGGKTSAAVEAATTVANSECIDPLELASVRKRPSCRTGVGGALSSKSNGIEKRGNRVSWHFDSTTHPSFYSYSNYSPSNHYNRQQPTYTNFKSDHMLTSATFIPTTTTTTTTTYTTTSSASTSIFNRPSPQLQSEELADLAVDLSSSSATAACSSQGWLLCEKVDCQILNAQS